MSRGLPTAFRQLGSWFQGLEFRVRGLRYNNLLQWDLKLSYDCIYIYQSKYNQIDRDRDTIPILRCILTSCIDATVYIYIYIYTYIYAHKYTNTIHINIHMSVCLSVCLSVWLYVCMYVCM